MIQWLFSDDDVLAGLEAITESFLQCLCAHMSSAYFSICSRSPPTSPVSKYEDVQSQPPPRQPATSKTTPAMKTPKRPTNQLSLSMPSPRLMLAAQKTPTGALANGSSTNDEEVVPLDHPSGAITEALKKMDGGEDW